jgi:uncharacterized damage-inducible protein DinB
MRRLLVLSAALVAAPLATAAAQQTTTTSPPDAKRASVTVTSGITADILVDIMQVQRKMLALARAIPADKYDWRPGTGVRSVNEVLMHVGSDNYLLPAAMGFAADPSTGIKGDDYKTAEAYEQRKMPRDSAIAQLERSFAHLNRSIMATPASRLGEKVSMFGQTFTVQQMWLMTATHLHEHLGQLIAYARSNSVTPPWSQGS